MTQSDINLPEHASLSPNACASSRTDTKDMVCLFLLVLAALAIRLWFIQSYRVISADGVAFARLARQIAQGSYIGALSSAQPPFYPLMIAAVHFFVDDVELAGRIAASLAGGLILIPLYFLAGKLGGRRAAIISCLLVAVWPSIRAWSGEVMSQSTYMLLIISAYLSYYRLLLCPTVRKAGVTAALFAFAYLTRPEAFIPFVLLSGYQVVYHLFIVKRGWSGIARQTATYWLVFGIIVSPYIIQIRLATGAWQLSAKSASVIGAALQEYLGRPDLYNEIGFKGFSLWEVVRSYPDYVISNTTKNLLFLYHDLPLYVWIPALVGGVICFIARHQRLERLWLLLSFSPLILIVTFYILGPEYSQFFWPTLFICFAIGVVWIESKAISLLGAIFPRMQLLLRFPWSLFVVLALSLYLLNGQIPDAAARNKPYTFDQDGGRYDHKLIGLRLKKVLPTGSKIMTRSGRISFYSELGGPLYPQASLEEIINVARRDGVRFLVVDGSLYSQRPQLGILLQPLMNPPDRVEMLSKGSGSEILPGIRLYYLYKDPSSLGVVVYELS